MAVVLLKAVIAIVLSTAILCLDRYYKRRGRWSNLKSSPFRQLLLLVFLLRMLPFGLVYVLLGYEAQSDVAGAFWPQAAAAAQGGVVYRDFETVYGPLFPYALSIFVHVWHHSSAVVLVMVLVEAATVVLTYLAFRDAANERLACYAALVYLLLPAPLILVLLGGQEDVWLWTVGVLAMQLLRRRHSHRLGLVYGCGLLVTKAYLLLPLVSTLIIVRNKLTFTLGLLFVIMPAMGILWTLGGFNILMPLKEESAVTPPNIWIILNAIMYMTVLGNAVFLRCMFVFIVVLSSGFWYVHSSKIQTSKMSYACAWIFTFTTFMVLSPKSLGNYVTIFLLPLTFAAVLRRDRVGMILNLALNVVAAIQPSLWFRLGGPLHEHLSMTTPAVEWLEFGLEVAAVGLCCGLMWWACSRVHANDQRTAQAVDRTYT